MTNNLVVSKRSNLVMPTHYVELTDEEMSYVEGGDYVISSATCNNIIAAFLGVGWFAFVGYSIACAVVGCTTIIGAISSLIMAIPGLLTVGIYAAAHAVVFAGYVVAAAVTGKDLHIGTILGFTPNPRKMWLS